MTAPVWWRAEGEAREWPEPGAVVFVPADEIKNRQAVVTTELLKYSLPPDLVTRIAEAIRAIPGVNLELLGMVERPVTDIMSALRDVARKHS